MLYKEKICLLHIQDTVLRLEKKRLMLRPEGFGEKEWSLYKDETNDIQYLLEKIEQLLA